MNRNTLIFLLVVCAGLISGCGSTYIRKDINPAISTTRDYGLMFTNLVVNDKRFPTAEAAPFSLAVTKAATTALLAKVPDGARIQVMDEQGDLSPVSKKIIDLSGNGQKREHLNPPTEYGDLSSQFKKNNIDVLIVLEMLAWGQKPSLAKTLGWTAAGIALGAPIGGGSPSSYMKILAVDASGKIIFSDWGVFSGGLLASKGDIFNDNSRELMVADMVNRYVNKVVRP